VPFASLRFALMIVEQLDRVPRVWVPNWFAWTDVMYYRATVPAASANEGWVSVSLPAANLAHGFDK